LDERLAALKLGIPLQFLKKEKVMAQLLGKLLASMDEKVILKGGTAINFAYLRKRFSEDLDFDCFACRNFISGPEFDGPWKFRETVRYHFVYQKPKDYVRVEIRKRKDYNPHKKFITIKNLNFFHGSIVANVRTYSLEFLVATKIGLLSERKDGKDFLDTYWGLKMCNPKGAISAVEKIEKKDSIVERAINTIEQVNPKRLAIVNNYIPRDNRPQSWRLLLDELKETLENLGN